MTKKNTYGKSELAELYGVSRSVLMSWFYDEFSKSELKKMRYNKFQKLFTKKQTDAIIQRIGNPFDA